MVSCTLPVYHKFNQSRQMICEILTGFIWQILPNPTPSHYRIQQSQCSMQWEGNSHCGGRDNWTVCRGVNSLGLYGLTPAILLVQVQGEQGGEVDRKTGVMFRKVQQPPSSPPPYLSNTCLSHMPTACSNQQLATIYTLPPVTVLLPCCTHQWPHSTLHHCMTSGRIQVLPSGSCWLH